MRPINPFAPGVELESLTEAMTAYQAFADYCKVVEVAPEQRECIQTSFDAAFIMVGQNPINQSEKIHVLFHDAERAEIVLNGLRYAAATSRNIHFKQRAQTQLDTYDAIRSAACN